MKRSKGTVVLFNKCVLALVRLSIKKEYTFELCTGYFKTWVFELHMDYNGNDTVWVEECNDKWTEMRSVQEVVDRFIKNT